MYFRELAVDVILLILSYDPSFCNATLDEEYGPLSTNRSRYPYFPDSDTDEKELLKEQMIGDTEKYSDENSEDEYHQRVNTAG
jgi:hypothetical protein